MQKLITLMSLLVFSFPIAALADDAETRASLVKCLDAEMYQPTEAGKPSFSKMDLSVEVVKSAKGVYGLAGVVTHKGKNHENLDTQVMTVPAAQAKDLKEWSQKVLENLDWNKVVEIRVGNVGVEANRQDGAGIMIYEMLDAKKTILGTVATVGWGFARCK